MNETVKADLTSPDIACKYDFKVDLNNDNLAHTLIVKLVGENKEVLDVGCATGYLDRVFVENGCTVTGIEVSEEAAQLARRYCKQVFTADLEEFNWGALRDHRFDVILFGDVLEHLKNPAKVLLDASASLASDGYVVASIPNVAHASLRLQLLQGEFRYRPLGLLDETHLRFFTYDTIKELFDQTGYVIEEVRRVSLGPFDTEIPVRREAVPQAILDFVLKDPEAITYQFVLRARPKERTTRTYSIEEIESKLASSRREAAELRTQREELQEQLRVSHAIADRTAAERDQLCEQLLTVRQDVAIKDSQNELLRTEISTLGSERLSLKVSNAKLFPHIDIVVVTYNSAAHLPGFFESVTRLNYPMDRLRVILVDNQSSDATVQVIASMTAVMRIPVDCLSLPRNIGFAGGVNAGITAGSADYICVVNPDGQLQPDALRELLTAFDKDSRIAIADARQVPYEHPKYYDPATGETSWCSGACCLIRRSALERVGLYDSHFFMYCEDVDLSWRFWSAGYKCVYAPRALLTHHKTPHDYRPALDYYYGVRNGLLMRLIYGTSAEIRNYYRDRIREARGLQTDSVLRGFLKRALVSHLWLVPHALRRRFSTGKGDRRWIQFSGVNYGEHRW